MKTVVGEVIKNKTSIQEMFDSLKVFVPTFITYDDKIDVVLYGLQTIYNVEQPNKDIAITVFDSMKYRFSEENFITDYDILVDQEKTSFEEILKTVNYDGINFNDSAANTIDNYFHKIAHKLTKNNNTTHVLLFSKN